MRYIKKRIEVLKADSFLSLTLKISLALAVLHFYQFYDSHFMITPLIKFCFCVSYPIIILFAGRTGSYIFFFIFGNFLACTTTFTNYTSFVILVILVILVPKIKIPTLVIYCADIIYVATVNNKTPVHIAIHVLNCILIYYCLFFLVKPTASRKKLNLTSDEIVILEALKHGKQQKEIEQFSQNTVTNKLKQARERNGIATTDELLQKYSEVILSDE